MHYLAVFNVYLLKHRDAPEPTGDEPDDADFEMPKIYEPVSEISCTSQIALPYLVDFFYFTSIKIFLCICENTKAIYFFFKNNLETKVLFKKKDLKIPKNIHNSVAN